MRGLISGKVLPWRRFWTPWNKQVRYSDDGRGFLPDPEERWSKALNPQLQTIEDLLGRNCIVLLGKPGMGKTIAVNEVFAHLQREVKTPDCMLAIHCRNVPSVETLKLFTIDSSPWREARTRSGNITLIVDGIDEGLRKVPEFVRAFGELIKNEPLDRLRLVLVCRSPEWDDVGGNELRAMWSGDGQSIVVELCPLRQQDAVAAAAAMKLDSAAFIKAVFEKGVQGMAARPITLKMLLDEFGQGRALSSSNRTLYLRAARKLCSEVDEDREKMQAAHYKRPLEEEIFRVTCRIAAMIMLCGKNVVLTSRAAPAANELPLSAITWGHEPSEGGEFEITPELVKTALETPLFTSCGVSRFGFDHQTFAEILAAVYLHDFDLPQIRRLLCQTLQNRDFVTPQLAEVASWLAGDHSGWADFLVKNDPEIFLRTDATEIAESQKERVIEALLTRANSMEYFEDVSSKRFYGALRHQRLAKQLRPVIADNNASPNVRGIAVSIAGHTKLTSVEPDLWRMARLPMPPGLFSDVAIALRQLCGKQSKKHLLQALRGGFPADTRRTLMGIALDVAVPKILPMSRVVGFLKSQPSAHRFGSYEMSLKYHLPKHLKKGDVAACLKTLRKIPACFDTLSGYHDLAVKAFDLALDHLNIVQIARELVALWIKCLRNHEPSPNAATKRPGEKTVPLFDDKRRQKFATALLSSPFVKVDDFFLADEPRLTDSDLEWLLAALPKAPVNRRSVWAAMITSLLWSAARKEVEEPSSVALSKHRSQLAATCAFYPKLRSLLPRRNARFGVVETMLRYMRATNLRDARRRARRQKRHPFGPPMPRKMRVESLLEGPLSSKHPTSWVTISEWIRSSQANDPDQPSLLCYDIKKSPGWQELNVVQQRRARQVACEFLLKCADASRPSNQMTNFTEAAYHAVNLLRHRIAEDRRLRSAVVRKWIAAVVDYGNNGESEHQSLLAFVYRLATASVIKRLLYQLAHEALAGGHALSLRAFAHCWDSRLSRAVLKYTKSANNAVIYRNVLLFLADHDPAAARKALITQFRKCASLRDKRTQACVCVAMIKFPAILWKNAWLIIASTSKAVSTRFFLVNSDEMDEHSPVPGCLSEEQAKALYLLLVRLFPPEKDVRHEGEYIVGPIERVQRLRESTISRIVDAGSDGGIRALQSIISVQPTQRREHLQWLYQRALHTRLQKLWAGHVPSPTELRELSRSRRTRLIESADDLLEAVVVSLEKCEAEMQAGELLTVHDFWNIHGRAESSPKPEDFVSRKIAAWLRRDLGKSVIVNREVQVESLGGGRTDLKIQAFGGRAFNPAPMTVIIEVKRCSHPEVRSACRKQLAEGYLRRNGWTHGIYLVAWFGHKSAEPARWDNQAEAHRAVETWAYEASAPSTKILGRVLDCRLNANKPPSSRNGL